MAATTVVLSLSTDGDGNGSVTDTVVRNGYVSAVHFNFSGDTDAGADTTLTCVSERGPDITLETISNSSTDAWKFPRALTNVPGEAAGLNDTPIMFRGKLRVTMAQGGATVTDAVTVTIYIDTAIRYALDAEALKIDQLTTAGLRGTSNSLAYRVHEIERHLHGRERWRGKKAVQTATDWADDVLTPFRATSGENAYGSDENDEALVLGTDDTPIIAGMVRYDLHRIILVNASASTAYKLRLVYGSGTMADAITAGQFSELVIMSDPSAQQVAHDVFDVMMPRGTSGVTKVWIQAWNATNNATVDVLVGLHEYEG